MAKLTQHEDFGEKIGGAKKDLWRQRGLYADDLSQMNTREADKYVKKDNIWKKPDYQAMIDGGIPFDIVYFIKTVRDSLNAAPLFLRTDDTDEKKLDRQKQYIDTVREVQYVMEVVISKDGALGAFERSMINSGYYERMEPGISGSWYAVATEKGRENPAITDKLSRALFFRSERDFEQKITQEAIREQFGVPKENKVPRGYEVLFSDGKYTYSANNDWKPNTYYVAKGHRILQRNFETRDAAVKWVQEFAKNSRDGKKKRFVPAQLEHVQRDGSDYRRGMDAQGQDYLDTFGFKGGEFGNWMTQNDRQASLNYGYDALKDLAAALSISDQDISFCGSLSIAFGARGSGNFVAHYEPLRQVINLTKMRGAGSLAHEWWHGLDDYLGTKLSVKGYLSDNPSKLPLFSRLIEAIKYKPETVEQAATRAEAQEEKSRRDAERWLTAAVSRYIKKTDEKALSEYERLKEAFLRGEHGSVDKLSKLKKSVSGHVISKNDREQLQLYERLLGKFAEKQEPFIGRVATDFYLNSKKMGDICEKDGGYWASNVEMTARAFAVYVMDKLQGRSDYLVGHAESAVGTYLDKEGNTQVVRAYPQGEERRAINQVFDELVAELKLQNYLTHDDRTVSLSQREFVPEPNYTYPNKACADQSIERMSLSTNFHGEQISLFDYDGLDFDIGDEDEYDDEI